MRSSTTRNEGGGSARDLAYRKLRRLLTCAGLEPGTIDQGTLSLLNEKGLDVTHLAPKYVYQVPDLDKFQVTVGLAERVKEAFPRTPRKMVYVDWSLDDPSQVEGSPEEVKAAYESKKREVEEF